MALKIDPRGSHAETTDINGDMIAFSITPTGQMGVIIRNGPRDSSAILTSREAHQLRDMLNRRFPNATAVQKDR